MTKDENTKRLERLKNIVLNMPELPGSYQYYDSDGLIIYVGKAKNLKKRVSSYFHKEVDRYKTKVLVSKIMDITYTIVKTEEDALLLENALIKKYNPRYNVLLKDGKTYPSICVTNEPFARIFTTRKINKKFGTFFGPYTNLGAMYQILDFIKKMYKPRACTLNITPESIAEGKHKECLKFHLGICGGCCIGKQKQSDYANNISAAKEILKGNTRNIQKGIWEQMQKAAEELRFEEAQELKEQYMLLEQYCAKSEIVSHTITDIDVFTCLKDENKGNAYVNFIHVKKGQINQSFTFEYKLNLDESEDEILEVAIPEIREKFSSDAKEIVVEKALEWNIPGGEFFVPQRGDKVRLLELSMMNCKQYRVDRLKQAEKLNPEQRATRLMKELQDKLRLPSLPMHIEAFDNSNIQGEDAVAGCVVFKKMKPSKKDYRKYIIKTVVGPDDYGSMEEVVKRRYGRIKEEGGEFPDLIICDGGIGQMNVVRHVIKDILELNIPIAGLAKNDKHRTNELLYGFPPQTIQLKTDSELFHVLTQLQDEVHRYAITFHRNKRSKSALKSELSDIKGIGEKTIEQLLKKYKSVKRIKEADYSEVAKIIGNSKAESLWKHWGKKIVKDN